MYSEWHSQVSQSCVEKWHHAVSAALFDDVQQWVEMGHVSGALTPHRQSSMAAAASACSRCSRRRPQCRFHPFTQL